MGCSLRLVPVRGGSPGNGFPCWSESRGRSARSDDRSPRCLSGSRGTHSQQPVRKRESRKAKPMILHVDMDAFFASVEQASNPRLLGRPVIVCGDPDRRGTVATASYEARAFGVAAGMPTGEAKRRCPEGVFLEGQPEKYRSVSIYLLELYKRITPTVEPFSIDEAFLDLAGTPYDADAEGAERAARTLQRWTRERLGLGATVGIGPNKL